MRQLLHVGTTLPLHQGYGDDADEMQVVCNGTETPGNHHGRPTDLVLIVCGSVRLAAPPSPPAASQGWATGLLRHSFDPVSLVGKDPSSRKQAQGPIPRRTAAALARHRSSQLLVLGGFLGGAKAKRTQTARNPGSRRLLLSRAPTWESTFESPEQTHFGIPAAGLVVKLFPPRAHLRCGHRYRVLRDSKGPKRVLLHPAKLLFSSGPEDRSSSRSRSPMYLSRPGSCLLEKVCVHADETRVGGRFSSISCRARPGSGIWCVAVKICKPL
ncbi:hypothetical protein CCHR01_03247 [Colletotrichum chrysophilum]|uniref:Uncharacterized protein n=1 Tax=Colletotrichum chrysophilum TaxID=1836956 RepID=A0AAD9AYT0_9PEZI|nr:hypothetical protein CCHR01_03247 [Colletotrichum chrysophilum]